MFKTKSSVSLCLCAHRYTYMCLNKYLSNEDAMHGVVLRVHLLHFTWESVAIPVLDCRYL